MDRQHGGAPVGCVLDAVAALVKAPNLVRQARVDGTTNGVGVGEGPHLAVMPHTGRLTKGSVRKCKRWTPLLWLAHLNLTLNPELQIQTQRHAYMPASTVAAKLAADTVQLDAPGGQARGRVLKATCEHSRMAQSQRRSSGPVRSVCRVAAIQYVVQVHAAYIGVHIIDERIAAAACEGG